MKIPVILQLNIENRDKSSDIANTARQFIEVKYLRRLAMAKIDDHGSYELTFTFKEEADLDKQVYQLLDKIVDQQERFNCEITVDAGEKDGDRRW